MDTEDLEWILTIRANAFELRRACEEFEDDVENPSFDVDDARACFELIKEQVERLEELLDL